MTDLFVQGDFTLHSGATSPLKIDCDALSDTDIATVAKMIAGAAKPFRDVVGVPDGGLRLAEELRQYAVPSGGHLLVDDVWTTGASLEDLRLASDWLECEAWVIFSRAPMRSPLPWWVHAVFSLDHDIARSI